MTDIALFEAMYTARAMRRLWGQAWLG